MLPPDLGSGNEAARVHHACWRCGDVAARGACAAAGDARDRLTPLLILAMLVLTVVMCIAAALAAILRVVRIDPVMVFTR